MPDEPDHSALIFNIMRFALHDGPGIRTVVFFKGCPLECWWCHNPESQSFLPDRLYFEERCRHCLDCARECPQHAIHVIDGIPCTSDSCTFCGHCVETCMADARQIAGRRYTCQELLAEVEKDVVFFDDSGGGVTLSGGEPVAQPAFAAEFLDACRSRGIRTAIETCGFARPTAFQRVALRADLVLFDLKLLDREKHLRYTGAANGLIRANLEDLVARGRPVIVRIPVVPGFNDSEEDMAAAAGYLGNLHPRAVELLPYHRIGAEKYRRLGRPQKFPPTPEPAAGDLARICDTLARAGLHVTLGGS